MREGTAEQNSPALAFFHALVIVEQRWDSKSKCRRFPHLFLMAIKGFCFVLLYWVGLASLQSFMDAPKAGFQTPPYSLYPFTCRDTWWEVPAAMVTFMELNKLRDGKEKRENHRLEVRWMKK